MLATLTEFAATPAPAWVPMASRTRWIDEGWPQVAEDPAPLLATGIVSAAWLERALPALVAASDPSAIEGTALLHLDVRSDNICFRDACRRRHEKPRPRRP